MVKLHRIDAEEKLHNLHYLGNDVVTAKYSDVGTRCRPRETQTVHRDNRTGREEAPRYQLGAFSFLRSGWDSNPWNREVLRRIKPAH